MPQYQSQLGQVGFVKQAAVGTAGTIATAAPTRWMKMRSSSVGGDRSLMIPDPEIQGSGGRDVPKSYLSPVSYSGDYEAYVRPEALPLAIYGALGGGGAAPTGSGVAGYTHSITPGDTLPVFTIQEKMGDSFDTFKYTDAYFNTLHLECAADGYFMTTLGVVARTQLAGETAATPAFDNTPQILGSNITISLGGSAVPASDFSFDWNNNIESNHFVLGSLLVDVMTPKRRDVTGSFTVRPQSNALFRQAMYGNAAATGPTGQPTVQNMTITATTYEIITGATTQVYTVTITIPEVELAPFKPGASGDDTMEHSIDFRAVKVAAANIATISVINGVSTAYNV